MRKQGKPRNVLSPIMDECTEPEPKPWAITQQHGRNMQKSPSKGESRTKIENKTKEGESKGKKSAESNKITLPVLGSLSMKIEAHNPYESEKKSNHEALYRSRLLRTKKQKSIEGMFQAAKANKELSQILLNMNPSFNLEIGEHNLHKFLAPNRHLVPDKVEDFPKTDSHSPSQPDSENGVEEDTAAGDADDVTKTDEVTLPPLPAPERGEEYPPIGLKPPPPLTAHELVRRSKVIEAVAPSTLWVPASSLQCGEEITS